MMAVELIYSTLFIQATRVYGSRSDWTNCDSITLEIPKWVGGLGILDTEFSMRLEQDINILSSTRCDYTKQASIFSTQLSSIKQEACPEVDNRLSSELHLN